MWARDTLTRDLINQYCFQATTPTTLKHLKAFLMGEWMDGRCCDAFLTASLGFEAQYGTLRIMIGVRFKTSNAEDQTLIFIGSCAHMRNVKLLRQSFRRGLIALTWNHLPLSYKKVIISVLSTQAEKRTRAKNSKPFECNAKCQELTNFHVISWQKEYFSLFLKDATRCELADQNRDKKRDETMVSQEKIIQSNFFRWSFRSDRFRWR